MGDDLKLSWGRNLPGDLLKRWPRTADGDYETPARLTTCSQFDMSDTLLINMLEARGIPGFRLYPHYGGFGNLMLGMSAEGVDIYVPESLLEDARMLMEGEPEDNGGEL